ncbi:cell wall glucanase [Pyronema omphalodes]|nr:cell wall glucanase [Pyronema omphalodes]
MHLLQISLLTAALLGFATADTAQCGAKVQMSCAPGLNPCCSQYGVCGAGAYCLGGCDPKFSAKPEACLPAPTCRSGDYKFTSPDRIADKARYLGDASSFDWVSEGGLKISGGQALLTMDPHTWSSGTVLSSTHYVWYGNIKATMKTSRGAGVITAFILMSNMKDEVDFEWVGVRLGTTETNYYFNGIENWNNGEKYTGSYDSFAEWHTYEIDWTPDTLTWKMDGNTIRTLKKSDTLDKATGIYHYPQTPSRVQLSIWPGGGPLSKPDTISWAGGKIDWVNHPDMKNPGYYYARVKDVSITCYDPPSSSKSKIKGSKSYTYDSMNGTQDTVVIGDDATDIKSSIATGLDPNKGVQQVKQSDLNKIETVPGLTGAGTGVKGDTGTTTAGSTADQGIAASGGSGSNTGAEKVATGGLMMLAGVAAVVAGFI